jgi:hypothetical protein
MIIYDKRQHTSTTLKRAVHPGGVPGGSTQQKRGMEARVEPSRARERQTPPVLKPAGAAGPVRSGGVLGVKGEAMWDYRVVHTAAGYAVYEVYYADDGTIEGRTEEPSYPMGDPLEALRDDLAAYLGPVRATLSPAAM